MPYFQVARLIFFSNLKPYIAGDYTLHLVLRLRGGGGELPKPRKFFPETWIWDAIDGK